jgi:cytoskeleton protein RodZ
MNDVALDVGSAEPVEPERPVSPGARLREARETQGLSLADVARHLKLSQRQVEALERDNFAALPGPVFVRGFMRNYARLVALDPVGLVAAAEASQGFPQPPATATNQMASHPVVSSVGKARRDGPRAKRAWWPVTAILILAAIALMYFQEHEAEVTGDPTEVALTMAEQASEVRPEAPIPLELSTPEDAAAVAVPEIVSPAAPAAVPPGAATAVPPGAGAIPLPAMTEPGQASLSTRTDPTSTSESFASASVGGGSGSGEVRLNFARDAWVEVKDATGSIVFSQLNTAGSERIVRGQPPFQLVVGNASGVTVTYNAREVDLAPHTRTDVARFTLD